MHKTVLRCTSSTWEQSLNKVWIKRNENFWSCRLHKLKLGTPKVLQSDGPTDACTERYLLETSVLKIGKYLPKEKITNKHGWKFKISKILNFWDSNLKTCKMPTKMNDLKLNVKLCLDNLKTNQRSYCNLPDSGFCLQNPEFRINPENFHPWICTQQVPLIVGNYVQVSME